MIFCTSAWRTTSAPVRRQIAISSMPSSTRMASLSPEVLSGGRSICVTSPVMTTWEPKPMRVKNIFICSREVFCASSRMMKLSSSVRPRI